MEQTESVEHPESVCPLTKGERILVAMDGSDHSERALDQAISMGRICNSTIFIINVIELNQKQLQVAAALVEDMSKETGALLERARERVNKEGIPCETIVRIGEQPHKVIIQEASDRNIDLIVMGTHGRTGLKSLLLGSVAERVIGNSPCTVMVTPRPRD